MKHGMALAAFLAVSVASTACAQDARLACGFERKEYVAGAAIPLQMTISREGAGAEEATTFLAHLMPDMLGSASCFKVKCWDAQGKELPPRIANPQEFAKQHVTKHAVKGDGAFTASVDLFKWFKPPVGGPYKVEAVYEWTEDVPKRAPHWKGRTNAATCEFSVRAMGYGKLDEVARAKVDQALADIPRYVKAKEHEQELIALGAPALPALHDALQLANLDLRASVLRVLAQVKSEESIPHIIDCPLMVGGNMIPLQVQKARDDALVAYGAAALPLLEKAAEKDESLKYVAKRIRAQGNAEGMEK